MIQTLRRVECDQCGAAGPEALASENPREIASDFGWVELGHVGDLCPDCQSKQAAKLRVLATSTAKANAQDE